MKLKIREGRLEDLEAIASIIREANIPVAKQFGITKNNAAKHPSNCTTGWIKNDLKRGAKYFVAEKHNLLIGCFAYENPEEKLAYLNRLAIFPRFQKKGIGQMLVNYHLNYSVENKIENVSLAIIDEHTELKNWYKKIGFVETETKNFDYLPFTVCFMNYKI